MEASAPTLIDGLPLWFFKVFALLAGAAFGSFANVVIYRVPLGKSIVRPGSACPSCGHEIRWFENIPILSWLILRARCSSCGQPISIRYPMIELMMAVLSLASMMIALSRAAGLQMTAGGLAAIWFFPFALCFLLVCIIFIDLEHWIIPHPLTIAGLALGVLHTLVLGGPLADIVWYESLIGIVAGALPIVAVIEVYFRLTGREGMGYGDVMLMGMAGAWFGYLALPFILLASSLQGLLVTIPMIIAKRRTVPPWEKSTQADSPGTEPETAESGEHETTPAEDAATPARHMAIPFGPFIGLSMLEWLFFGNLITDWFLG